MNTRHPTMHVVARDAGVSVGTVSNALNRPEILAPDTLARVLDAIDRVGYIRSSAGRMLTQQHTDGIGLVVPDIINRLFIDLARGAQVTAHEHNTRLLMANALFDIRAHAQGEPQPDQQDAFLDYFAEARVSGLLLATMRDPTSQLARVRNHIPAVVVINYAVPDAPWCSVLMDNPQVGRLVAHHLADIGITRAYFLSTPDTVQPIAERRAGLHTAANTLNIEVTDVTTSGLGFADGHAAAMDLLPSFHPGERVAILGLTDQIALGALDAIRSHPRLAVPDDIAVVGMDGHHRSQHSDWMGLTSIDLPGYDMGMRAVQLLTDESSPTHVHQHVTLPVTLTPRESTVAGRSPG